MEESDKRKERLKAMRMEAAEGGNITELAQNSLMNPLTESPSPSPSPSFGQPQPRPRFDYYTDPMSAFSINRRKDNVVSHQVSNSFPTPPRPIYSGSPAYHARGNYIPGQRPYQPRGINAIPLGIRGNFSPVRTPPPGNSPNTCDSSFGTPNYYFRPSSPKIGDFPQGGGTGSQYGQGSPHRGSGYRGSPHRGFGFRGFGPHQDSGQGRGRWTGNKGKGSHQFTSAESRPDLFYVKSMVEDPWEPLKPIIWKPRNPPLNSYDTRNSPKSWLPNSISAKKTKVGEAPTYSTPQKSLAEYLAAAFDEAAGKEVMKEDESGS